MAVNRQLLGVLMIVMCAKLMGARGQSVHSSQAAAETSVEAVRDPGALDLLHRVLANLGGVDGWKAVGAARAVATFSLPDDRSLKIQWSDDWSGPKMLSKREALGGPEKSHQAITSGDFKVHVLPSGQGRTYLRDPDITLMAVGYPGAAILRSLDRRSCSISMSAQDGRWPQQLKSIPSGEVVIYEQCTDPLFPDGRVNLAWVINTQTSTLVAAWLPVRGMANTSQIYQEVRYQSFQRVGALLVSHDLVIVQPNGRTQSVVVDEPHLSKSLSASFFSIHN